MFPAETSALLQGTFTLTSEGSINSYWDNIMQPALKECFDRLFGESLLTIGKGDLRIGENFS